MLSRALHDQRRGGDPRQAIAAVDHEHGAAERTRDVRIERAQPVAELAHQLGRALLAHRHRRERLRPRQLVALHRVEDALDLGALEAAEVVRRLVDEARRGAQQHQALEAPGLHGAREQADDAADRMADVGDALQAEGVEDVEQIERVAVQRAVPAVGVGAAVGAAEADVVEVDHSCMRGEGRGHEAPGALVRAEAVAEDQRLGALAGDTNVVLPQCARVHHELAWGQRWWP